MGLFFSCYSSSATIFLCSSSGHLKISPILAYSTKPCYLIRHSSESTWTCVYSMSNLLVIMKRKARGVTFP